MQDSMAFEDIKAMKKGAQNANLENEPIMEENSQNQSKITGQFERSIDNSRVNQSQAHYMEVAQSVAGGTTTPQNVQQQQPNNHYMRKDDESTHQ